MRPFFLELNFLFSIAVLANSSNSLVLEKLAWKHQEPGHKKLKHKGQGWVKALA